MPKPKVTDQDWALIRRIIAAFRGVTLEEGIGLSQAEGMDDYAPPERLERLRSTDEKENWERINTDNLNECSCALSYFDAKGMRFHLPAYLIASLKDELEVDLMFYLTCLNGYGREHFSLLNSDQRSVVKEFLELCLIDSDEVFGPDVEQALNSYWNSPVHIGFSA